MSTPTRSDEIAAAVAVALDKTPPLHPHLKLKMMDALYGRPEGNWDNTPAPYVDPLQREIDALRSKIERMRSEFQTVADRCQGCDVPRSKHHFTEHCGIHHKWRPMRIEQIEESIAVHAKSITEAEADLAEMEARR